MRYVSDLRTVFKNDFARRLLMQQRAFSPELQALRQIVGPRSAREALTLKWGEERSQITAAFRSADR